MRRLGVLIVTVSCLAMLACSGEQPPSRDAGAADLASPRDLAPGPVLGDMFDRACVGRVCTAGVCPYGSGCVPCGPLPGPGCSHAALCADGECELE